jgi:hypothetical protein
MNYYDEYIWGVSILAFLLLLFYQLLKNRDKRHKKRLNEDLLDFERAVNEKNIPQIHRNGLNLVRNIHLSKKDLLKIQDVVKLYTPHHPILEELVLAVEYKIAFGVKELPI